MPGEPPCVPDSASHRQSPQPRNSREGVETGIEAHDFANAVLLHYGEVNRIAGRDSLISKDNPFGPFHDSMIDRQDFIDDFQQGIECRLNGIETFDGLISMQNFLQNFGIGDQSLALPNLLFDEQLRFELAGRVAAHQVHGNIGINQNQSWGPRGILALSQ
jgi:hypothetical protein